MEKNMNESKQYVTRLRKIEGQIRGLQKMVEDGRYCVDIITQTSAVRSALRAFEDMVLKAHLGSCALSQMKSGDKKEEQKAIEEIIKVYTLKR